MWNLVGMNFIKKLVVMSFRLDSKGSILIMILQRKIYFYVRNVTDKDLL